MGGHCDVNADCVGDLQYVPGTTCQDNHCKCADPSLHICCRRGEEKDPECFLECLSCDACAPETPGCEAPPQCDEDADCPDAPDLRCGAGQCIDGTCSLEIKPGALASQIRGDCERVECSDDGHIIVIPDISDSYNDGNQCTIDFCEQSTPLHAALDQTICPASNVGRCSAGTCVECDGADPSLNDCPGDRLCDYTTCVPVHCVNGRADPGSGETGFDCGGPCRPCPVSSGCRTGADCIDGVCIGNSCKLPTCTDGVKNGTETGVDCGAPPCPLCRDGQGCQTNAECVSAVCWAGLCAEPTCTDGVRNRGETGVDCGGNDCAPCPE